MSLDDLGLGTHQQHADYELSGFQCNRRSRSRFHLQRPSVGQLRPLDEKCAFDRLLARVPQVKTMMGTIPGVELGAGVVTLDPRVIGEISILNLECFNPNAKTVRILSTIK